MRNVVHEQTGGASEPIDPRRQLAHYRQRIKSLKEKLDEYEERRKFTHPIIHGHIQILIRIQREIVKFKESLPARDQRVFDHLLDGIRDAVPYLGKAEEERAKINNMSLACHKLINGAIKHLERALRKTVGQ